MDKTIYGYILVRDEDTYISGPNDSLHLYFSKEPRHARIFVSPTHATDFQLKNDIDLRFEVRRIMLRVHSELT